MSTNYFDRIENNNENHIYTGKFVQQNEFAAINHLPVNLGTVQSLFYNMAGAKRNGATTFFELVHNWVNTFY